MKKLLIILSLAAVAICQADPIQVSITGTAKWDKFEYTSGQSYTFSWVINEGYAGNTGDNFSLSQNSWYENSPASSKLFSSLSGDGITGSYTSSDPHTGIDVFAGFGENPSEINIVARDNFRGLGMTIDEGPLTRMEAFEIQTSINLSFPDTYTDPTAYFSNYTGTYAISSGYLSLEKGNSGISFTPTSMTIAAIAIPEPASLGLLGLVSGGIFFTRRLFVV